MRALEDVATELYSVPLADFTGRRSALAKQLRTEDEQLADAVARLPKPVVSAWAMNHYARERADELDDLLALGEQLREAQQELAGDRMKALTANATALVQRTLKGVARLASDAGTPLGHALLPQVEQTLRAALADADAAAAVRAGVLVKPLASGGFGPVDLAGAVALVPAGSPPRTVPRKLSVVRPTVDERRQEARKTAEAALAQLERAEADLAESEAELRDAEEEHAKALARRDELRASLKDAEREEQGAARRMREAVKAKERAGSQVDRAAERAKQAVDAT